MPLSWMLSVRVMILPLHTMVCQFLPEKWFKRATYWRAWR